MITTILIVLVAVVVLIVIIAVLALRYLRADDSDAFDSIPDEPRPRRGSERHSGQFPGSPARQQRQREPVTDVWADRPQRQAGARGQQPGFRDRDTGPRPAVPERAASQVGGQWRAAADARPARPGRADDPDSVTSSWESLSDVDYWTELAADKSPAPALQRRQPARPGNTQPGRGPEPTVGPPPDFDAGGRRGGPRPGAPVRGRRGPADDDPLTSPSFPAVNAADSRSYRARRSGSSQPGTTGANGYPPSSDRNSRPEGYPVQSPAPQSARHSGAHSASHRAAQTPPPSRPSAGSPAANPYGSFVSAPPSEQHPSFPDVAAASRNTADYPAASQPTRGGRHSARRSGNGDAAGSAADGYLPAAALGAAGSATNGRGQRHGHTNGSSPSGYAGIDYGSLRYDDQANPDGDSSGLVGYAAPRQPDRRYDPAYDSDYGQDGYQGYTGYGAGER